MVDTQDELLVRILDAAASIKKRESRHQQHSIFAQNLQSALWMTVGFSNISLEAQQIYHFCVTNLSLKHKITVKSKLNIRVSNISFFITIHNTFVSVDSKALTL
jgi:hypothetical protein